MLSRLCVQAVSSQQFRGQILKINKQNLANAIRSFRHEAPRNPGTAFGQRGANVGAGQKVKSLKERLLSPTTGAPFAVGQLAVGGASALGLGALCFYGAGLSREAGALDRSMAWPQYVRDRIHATYMYFGGSILFTAGSAAAVLRSPTIMNLAMRSSLLATFVSIGLMMASSALVHAIPYKEGFGPKQMAWMLHSAVIGTVLAPMTILGGPVLIRAAVYTAGIVGALSAIAVTAPSEQFLKMGGPLAIGFGAVFAASIGSMFLSPATAVGAGLYSISLYGGLILFSGLMLYDTQKIIKKAENHPPPPFATHPYDPVNASVSIFMDAVNIFIRIAMMLANGGNRKK